MSMFVVRTFSVSNYDLEDLISSSESMNCEYRPKFTLGDTFSVYNIGVRQHSASYRTRKLGKRGGVPYRLSRRSLRPPLPAIVLFYGSIVRYHNPCHYCDTPWSCSVCLARTNRANWRTNNAVVECAFFLINDGLMSLSLS